MKKIVSLVVCLMLTLVVATGYAQVRAGSVNITPTVGGYFFEGNEDMDNSIALGLRVGYNFIKYVGVEGFVQYVPTKCRDSKNPLMVQDDVNVLNYGIEGIFNILPDKAFVPFVALGVQGINYSRAYEQTTDNRYNKIAVDYGAGVKYFLSENWALRADVRHVIPFDRIHNNLLASVGLTFAFGGAKPAPAPEPVVEAPPVVEPPPPPPVVEEVKPKAAAAPEIIEKGRTTLKVLFDFDKSTIKKGYFGDIDNLVSVMKQYPDLNVIIEGHTDSVGTAAYNKKLSQRRAEAVKKYMIEKGGIDANRLSAVGYGLEKPIASNKTKAGRDQNRRVEAVADYLIKK